MAVETLEDRGVLKLGAFVSLEDTEALVRLLLMRDAVKPNRPAWLPHHKDSQDKPLTPAQVQCSTQAFLLHSGTPVADVRRAGKGHGRAQGYHPASRKRYEVIFKTQKPQCRPKIC